MENKCFPDNIAIMCEFSGQKLVPSLLHLADDCHRVEIDITISPEPSGREAQPRLSFLARAWQRFAALSAHECLSSEPDPTCRVGNRCQYCQDSFAW